MILSSICGYYLGKCQLFTGNSSIGGFGSTVKINMTQIWWLLFVPIAVAEMNYYKALNTSANATTEEIECAYYQKMCPTRYRRTKDCVSKHKMKSRPRPLIFNTMWTSKITNASFMNISEAFFMLSERRDRIKNEPFTYSMAKRLHEQFFGEKFFHAEVLKAVLNKDENKELCSSQNVFDGRTKSLCQKSFKTRDEIQKSSFKCGYLCLPEGGCDIKTTVVFLPNGSAEEFTQYKHFEVDHHIGSTYKTFLGGDNYKHNNGGEGHISMTIHSYFPKGVLPVCGGILWLVQYLRFRHLLRLKDHNFYLMVFILFYWLDYTVNYSNRIVLVRGTIRRTYYFGRRITY